MLGVDDGEDASNGLAEVVDLVELGAGRDDLLDAQLAELGLELAELLQQVILALVPELDSLNLCGRLRRNGSA